MYNPNMTRNMTKMAYCMILNVTCLLSNSCTILFYIMLYICNILYYVTLYIYTILYYDLNKI